MIDTASQVWVTVFGVTALWLAQSPSGRTRAWGALIGLAGQPGWYVQLVLHGQWLMLPAYLLYTACWLRGCWVGWIMPLVDAAFAELEGAGG